MHNLRELQKNFQNYILENNLLISKEITTTKEVSTATRLSIYRDGYYLRLLEILELDYEVLRALMGEEAFNNLGQHYIKTHPSTFRSVRWFGKYLADYLQNFLPDANQTCLVEMAKFEWFLTESFDAPEGPIINIEEMARLEPEKWAEMHFKLHPSVRRINLCWNIIPIWNAFKNAGACIAREKVDGPLSWIIWRNEIETQFLSLSIDEAYMIDAMLSGEDFGSICAGLCEWVEEQQVAMHAALLLKRFILDKLIMEIVV